MIIQAYSDTNYSGLVDDLERHFGDSSDIGTDPGYLQVEVEDYVSDSMRFWDVLSDWGAEILP